MSEHQYQDCWPCRSVSHRMALFGGLLILVLATQLRNQAHLSPLLPYFLGNTVHTAAADGSANTERHRGNTTRTAPSPDHPYTCSFRDYKRFYGLQSESYPRAFLRAAHYIHGLPPMLLPLASSSSPSSQTQTQTGKVCTQPTAPQLQQAIQFQKTGERTFLPLDQPKMDGTNPTLISLERLTAEIPYPHSFPIANVRKAYPTAVFLVSSTYKSANQCDYDIADKHKSKESKNYSFIGSNPPGRHHRNEVDLLLVDDQLQTIFQTTLQDGILRDTIRSTAPNTHEPSSIKSYSADDVRLLVHDGAVWLTFKRYGDQGGHGAALYLAKLQFSFDSSTHSLQAKAIREVPICCGRNFMALSSMSTIPQTPSTLSFVTWPDPVWVQSLDTAIVNGTVGFANPQTVSKNRFGKTSSFHGTSGFLLYLDETKEYLGVGHIHRERKWAKDHRVDAKFGHHYTHAFFTMSAHPPYQLTRVSQEFLFPSKVKNHTLDADVIQFASGLEWVPSLSSSTKQVVLGYGINDCEGGIVYVDWKTVEAMLRPVPPETQVGHTMANMSRNEFVAVHQRQQKQEVR